MSGDVYNVKEAGAVGPGSKNIVYNAPEPPGPPKPPKPSSWMAIAGVTLATGLAVSGFLFFGLPGSAAKETSDEIQLANASTLPPAVGTASLATKSATGPRLALVIAQTDYAGNLSDIELAQAEADAIATALQETEFEVTSVSNASKTDLAMALDAFRRQLDQAGDQAIGFVYYTGHGAQHPESGDSYLLGIDANLQVASDLTLYGLDLNTQRDVFAATGAQAVFLVFDACRNVPAFTGYKASIKGINRIEASSDMLVAYSTRENEVAQEGLYAPILAEELKRPQQTAETAFTAAQRRVASNTNRTQIPFTDIDLINTICFASCPPSQADSPAQQSPP